MQRRKRCSKHGGHRWDLEDESREASWIAVIAARQALIELKKWPKLAGLHEGMNSRSDLESRAVVGELFQQLKPEHRVVLALSVHHGMTIHEIAEVLDIPPGTVGSRIHAAREQFKKLWSGAS
jgi:RNA polymerase sigma-70 factor (ECF subfamily)